MQTIRPTRYFGDAPIPSVSDVRSPTSTEVRSPTSTSTATEVRSPTSTATEVRSPTSTSTEVRSPTSTSTDAYTQGNITVTGGAGAGATTSVTVCAMTPMQMRRADEQAHLFRSQGAAGRPQALMTTTSAPRPDSAVPTMMRSVDAPRAAAPIRDMMQAASSPRAPQGPSALGAASMRTWGWLVAGGVATALAIGAYSMHRGHRGHSRRR